MYDEQPEQVHMQATSYCLKGRTATGTRTRKGICASSRKHFGEVAQVYKRNKDGSIGEFIGYFSCEDTGGESISSGRVMDIWCDSYDSAIKFGRKNIIVVWVKGDG